MWGAQDIKIKTMIVEMSGEERERIHYTRQVDTEKVKKHRIRVRLRNEKAGT